MAENSCKKLSDEGLVSKLYEELSQLNNKNKTPPEIIGLKMWTKSTYEQQTNYEKDARGIISYEGNAN